MSPYTKDQLIEYLLPHCTIDSWVTWFSHLCLQDYSKLIDMQLDMIQQVRSRTCITKAPKPNIQSTQIKHSINQNCQNHPNQTFNHPER